MIEAEPARLDAGGARAPRQAHANLADANRNSAMLGCAAEWLAAILGPGHSGDSVAASAHPFFDQGFWRESLNSHGLVIGYNPSLTDYFERPETWVASPHPLFDPTHYADQLARMNLVADPRLPPLADMLRRTELVSCHYLFAPDYYVRQAELEGVEVEEHPLLHYLRGAGRTGLDPHPLFDTAFYLAGLGEEEIPAESTPLEHFLREGSRKARDPSPLFSQHHYRQQLRLRRGEEFEALRHYIEEGGRALLDPHPRFDARYYAATHPDCLDGDEAPLTHFVRGWLECGFRCPPWGTTLATRHGHGSYPEPIDVILVSHEMTLTGAPKILLKIAEHLARERGQNILVISARGGPLLEEFREWASVFSLAGDADWDANPIELTRALCESMSSRTRPRFAIVNTACVARLGTVLGEAGLPMVTLVHELASGFSKEEFDAIYDASALVIYPAEFVRAEAHQTFGLPTEKSRVLPQGLLDPQFGQGDPLAARETLLAEIGAPEDAFVVLGCGTLDLRKGVDIFVRTAAATKAARGAGARPIHFVWVGGGAEHPYSPFWYARQDMVRGGLEDRVHFVGSRVNAEPYFLGCDAFAVTSRMDPFPCVVHEAMACAKPVIAFANAGGAPEALVDGAGIVVPYGDSTAMARAIGDLAGDEATARDLGVRALERVRGRYSFFDYVESIVAAVGRASDVELIDRLDFAPRRGRILFALGDWRADTANTFTERLASGLRDRGFEPEIVFTGLGAAQSEATALPRIPYRFLASKLQERLGFLARCDRLERGVRAAAPAIYIHDMDPVGSAVAPVLPKDIGVLRILDRSDGEHLEQASRLGRYWQRIVATTPTIANRFAEVFPEWAAGVIELPRGALHHAALIERAAGGPLRVVCAAPPADRHDLVHFLRSVFPPCGEAFDYVLTLVGMSQEHEKLRLVFDAEVAAGAVRFCPTRSGREMTALFRESDVMLTLDQELGALDLPEVMSLGTIVVAAFGRAPPWIGKLISGGANGYLLPLSRPETCRETLTKLTLNWNLRAEISRAAFETGRAEVVDIELVCDRYAAVLDGMLADIRGGQYIKPAPVYVHPVLGGVSLPPALLVNPDSLPGRATYEQTGPEPDPWEASHPGWALVVELGAQSSAAPYGEASLHWRAGELEIDKPEGDGGVVIQLERNASHVLMVRVTLRSEATGNAMLFSQTITEAGFMPRSRTDHGYDAGSNRLRATLIRDASVRALRFCPSERAGRFHVERLAVFAPARHGWEDDQAPILPVATAVDFRLQGDADEYLAGGWYAPERELRWSHGSDGRVLFSAGNAVGARLWVLCRVVGTVALGALKFELMRPDGAAIGAWVFPDDGWRLQPIDVTSNMIQPGGAAEIAFHSDDIAPLDTLGLSKDGRSLGLGIRAMALFPASADPVDVEAAFGAVAVGAPFRVETPAQ